DSKGITAIPTRTALPSLRPAAEISTRVLSYRMTIASGAQLAAKGWFSIHWHRPPGLTPLAAYSTARSLASVLDFFFRAEGFLRPRPAYLLRARGHHALGISIFNILTSSNKIKYLA